MQILLVRTGLPEALGRRLSGGGPCGMWLWERSPAGPVASRSLMGVSRAFHPGRISCLGQAGILLEEVKRS